MQDILDVLWHLWVHVLTFEIWLFNVGAFVGAIMRLPAAERTFRAETKYFDLRSRFSLIYEPAPRRPFSARKSRVRTENCGPETLIAFPFMHL